MRLSDAIALIFQTQERLAYLGEPVSDAEHALRSAHRAQRDGASDALVVAALLHDHGHLDGGTLEDLDEHEGDGRHEVSGAAWLERAFAAAAAEPARLRVPAKRYLCAVDPAYPSSLSPALVPSLGYPGGPFDAEGVAWFDAEPYHRDDLCLRRWNDAAKDPNRAVPGVVHNRDRIEAVALHPTGAHAHGRANRI
jgi:predicted HD phosphohydrolase